MQWKGAFPNSTCGAGWKKHPMPGKIFPTLWLMVQTAFADSYYLFLVSCHLLSPSACQQTTAAFTRLSTAPCHFMAPCSKSVAATICFNISRCLSNFLFLTAPLPLAVGAFYTSTWIKFRRLTNTAFNFSWCQTIHNNTAHPSLYIDPSQCEREREGLIPSFMYS